MEKIKCAHCQLDVILREGQRYCKYCGKPLMNKCTKPHCGKPLDDDAAFCPYCGHESKFKIKGLVRSPVIDYVNSVDKGNEIENTVDEPIVLNFDTLNETNVENLHSLNQAPLKHTQSQHKNNESPEEKEQEVFPVFV